MSGEGDIKGKIGSSLEPEKILNHNEAQARYADRIEK